jgi:hypothetical protein
MWRRVYLVWADVSEERRLTQDLHVATFPKTAFLIVYKDWFSSFYEIYNMLNPVVLN